MKKCLECGKELNKKGNKFCNRSCAVTYNNRKTPKRVKAIKECENCGKVMSKTQNKYCNVECSIDGMYKNITLPKFLAGELYNNSTIRKVLIKLFEAKCSECNVTSSWNDKPLTLEVDHIDGNSDNCFPNNLRLLCPNCHSQQITSVGGIVNKKKSKRNKYLQEYKK